MTTATRATMGSEHAEQVALIQWAAWKQGAAVAAERAMEGRGVKPYYQHNGITIYHGDWRSIAPPAADLVLADPPYGANIVRKNGHGAFKGQGRKVDNATTRSYAPIIGDAESFDPLPVIALQIPSILWGANYYADKLPPARGWFVWDKENSGDFGDVELAWTNIDTAPRLFRHMWNGMLRASERDTPRVHPTQKPVALMRWCLQRARLAPGALVFDPYMGSGPVAQACKELGYRYVGCELVEQYCEVAARRLSQEVMELA